ncbi:phosphoadenosine phosphosulfate reductase domain-containing protein [Lentzea cavernae]|uniref:Phosphoadenosine phosphosulphate reductase domain-containing protein n=1 Tax=Lentzea cavernae TaxID=2020703 RepID=A0ABQ3MRI6_9PSEU|nr:phosphoadenosine phosphosulfate reductase family protein [Lentzea cavernae]GHH57547.1 hypothetical protein GCM10017774_77220 [Lentzea cavernae]
MTAGIDGSPATRRVPMWSSGITSWAVARMVIERYGRVNTTLLFADTLAEDEDNYRFNREATAQLGMELTVVCDGRNPQQVNVDTRWLSNSRTAKCSELLKIVPSRKWLEANCDPANTVLYLGLDWTEPERVETNRRMWAPWRVEFPLVEAMKTKEHWIAECRATGVMEPEMYRLGFPHANCGGACVRAGQGQWGHLLRTRGVDPAYDRDRFAKRFTSWEAHERHMNELTRQGKEPVSIVREERRGETVLLPLPKIRQRVESQPALLDLNDWGGCSCFTAGSGFAS